MKTCLLFLLLVMGLPHRAGAAQEKPILEIVPAITELGQGWTTNFIAYLIDPQSDPPEIDYQRDPKTSPMLGVQREAMKTNRRTGCAMVHYGRGDLVMNRGLYRVTIQRWSDMRSLHNAFVAWKMNPSRVVRSHRLIGEDLFWINEWWRETLMRQDFVFLRGLFHVVIETGADSDYRNVLRLAEVIDAKILGRPIPKQGELDQSTTRPTHDEPLTFYVSPKGHDADPGTEDQPFGTLGRAIRAARAEAGGQTRRIIVCGGEYLGAAVELTAEDSGLIIEAATGEQPPGRNRLPHR